MTRPLLIVGASGRAAAASAIRAGYEPFVIDLFADADTQRLGPVWKCDPAEYPQGFLPLARQAPPGPWMYTGGLENFPDLVAEISADRDLLGNDRDVLLVARNEQLLAKAIRAAGGNFPETRPVGSPIEPEAGQRWLRKSSRSSGGGHVRFATPSDFQTISQGVHDSLQLFVDGRPMSALFRREADQTALVGMTVQLIGTPWLHAPTFGYAGNIVHEDAALRHGMLLHLQAYQDIALQHCWGVDFLDTGSGMPWTIEVNPRYTAAVEVLEYATGQPFLGPIQPPKSLRNIVGKAIYYAADTFTVPDLGPWDDSLKRCTDVWHRPEYADIPQAGSMIEKGQPVITILAEAANEAECRAELQRKAKELDRLFRVPGEVCQ